MGASFSVERKPKDFAGVNEYTLFWSICTTEFFLFGWIVWSNLNKLLFLKFQIILILNYNIC